MFEELKERYRAFCEWQKVPHHVKPMSDEEHQCSTCGRRYVGNFCPQCGQSAQVGRYSFKNAFLLYLDVWGLGNRGMFRTIRDLFLRPGYMIRDYLNGMQMAYFPPFKMLFLIITLSLLVNTGLNIKGENRLQANHEHLVQDYQTSLGKGGQTDRGEQKTASCGEQQTASGSEQQAAAAKAPTADEEPPRKKVDTQTAFNKMALDFNEWQNNHMAIFNLILLIPLSWMLFLAFRHSPNIPDMRFAEFFVAMVYMSNLMSMVTIVMDFFCLDETLQIATYPLIIVPLKQLTGYGYVRCILSALLAFMLAMLLLFMAMLAVGIVYAIIMR